MTYLMILERLSLNQTSYASGTQYIVRTYANTKVSMKNVRQSKLDIAARNPVSRIVVGKSRSFRCFSTKITILYKKLYH
jgi:hypothetical protein